MHFSLKYRLILAFVLAVLPVVLLGFSMLYRNTGSVKELQSKLEQSQFMLMELHSCSNKLYALERHKSREVSLSSCQVLLDVLITQDDYREHAEALNLLRLSKLVDQKDSTVVVSELRQMVDYFTPLTIIKIKMQAESLIQGTGLLPKILAIQVLLAALMAIVLGIILSKQILLPLQKLLTTINAVTSGNWGTQVEIVSADELGQVSTAFNRLSVELNKTAISKEHFRLIFDTINEGLILADFDGQIKQSNASLVELSGYGQQQIAQLSVTELFKNCDWSALLENSSELGFELELLASSGEIVPVSVLAARFPGGKGVAQIVLTVRDERSRIAARKEREEFQKKIVHAERLSALGSLSAEVAHRLNQPLTSMRLFLQQIKRDLSSKSSSHQNLDTIALCLQEVDRASKAVKSILGYTRRSDSDRNQLVNLNEIVKRVFALHAESSRAARMLLLNNLPDDLMVAGSEPELSELFFVLTQNAIDAACDQQASQLQVSAQVKDNKLSINVEDDAGGIAEQISDQVFEPFVTGKSHGKGTGLGLSIARKIAEDHGGSISVDSQVGRGTKFTIELPLSSIQKLSSVEARHV